MSSITSVEKLTRNLEHIDRPRENLKFHNGPIPSSAPFPPQGRSPPQSDLGRRPVLLWTAHSAVEAAAPCESRRRQGASAVPDSSRALGRPALHLGEARRGNTLPSETSKPSSWERLMAWGSQAPGWDAVMPPWDPGTTRAAAVRALGAASRPSGPLGRPGPASRSPTP